ncbi:hypothetical protein Hanom_Chr16g01477971 [Helianthus anomalus]
MCTFKLHDHKHAYYYLVLHSISSSSHFIDGWCCKPHFCSTCHHDRFISKK